MISVIIPTYRMPEYLDLCVKSAVEGRERNDTEIIVVVDGYVEESLPVLDKYGNDIRVLPLQENKGMQYALNVGVMNASNPYVFIMNDDNVFGSSWDEKIREGMMGFNEGCLVDSRENIVMTVNQVEPNLSIYNFVTKNFGRTANTFRYDEWLKFEDGLGANPPYSDDGRIFPFLISKKWYMTVGGFDTLYNSPFWCDCDFWLKCEMMGQLTFKRYHSTHLYHFGSIATKNRGDAESELFKRSEGPAAEMFRYKWGYLPNLVEASKFKNNSKLPVDVEVNGIKFK